MVEILSHTKNATLHQSNISKNTTNINFKCANSTYVVCIKPKKMLRVRINENTYELNLKIQYNFMCKTDRINILINRMFLNEILDNNEILEFVCVFEYGNPAAINKCNYQILYSFDSNYFHGAFTSIYSLIHNFNKTKLLDLNVNLCVPEIDFKLVTKELDKFIRISKLNVNYTLTSSTMAMVDKGFMDTKCYKGGNHLLKLSNFSRLVAGQFIESNKLLYIDSDTIVQTDMSKCLDKIIDTNYAVLGKKSHMNYTNLININNVSHVKAYLGNNFDLTQNVIYTGTMILNTKNFRKFYPKMIDLVKRHNKVKNGMYKLFTMSIINLAMNNHMKFADEYIINVVDLGFKSDLEKENNAADVLDWSGMFKPWFTNGLYKEYWIKYNIMYNDYCGDVMYLKDTTEKFT